MKRQFTAIILTLVMIISLLPNIELGVQAAGAIEGTYSSPGIGLGVMNKKMSDNVSFLNTYGAETVYNNAREITGLSYWMTEEKKVEKNHRIYDEGDIWDAYASQFIKLFKGGEIWTRFGAKLRGDKHGSVKNHPVNYKYSYQYMTINGVTAKGPNNDDRKMTYAPDGDDLFTKLSGDCIHVKIGHGGCSKCGSPKFSNPVVLFADRREPTFTGWYVTDRDNATATDAPSRDESIGSINAKQNTLYIHFEASEQLRFADNGNKHDDIYLGIRLGDVNTGKEVDKTYWAKLYALRKNVVTFKFVVPSKLNIRDGVDVTPEHYIHEFEGIYQNKDKSKNALNTEDGFNLTFYVKGKDLRWGNKSELGAANNKLKNYLSNTAGYTKTKSVFTDMSGNPMASGNISSVSAVGRSSKIFIDYVGPSIYKIDVDAYRGSQLLTAEVKNGNPVNPYVKAGDKLVFTVTMSEMMTYQQGKDGSQYKTVTLNLKNGNGSAVILPLSSYNVIRINNSPPARAVLTYRVTLTEDMVPTPGESIKITGCDFSYSWEDMYGNPASIQNNIPAPLKQVYLDTIAPTVNITNEKEGDEYKLLRDGNTFYFDFSLKDPVVYTGHTSGVLDQANTRLGYFSLHPTDPSVTTRTAYGFKLGTIDGAGAIPYWTWMSTGGDMSFVQMENAQRLIINIPSYYDLDVIPLKLKFRVFDYAGNEGVVEFPLNEAELLDIADRVGPQISYTDDSTHYDDLTGKGSITVTAELFDKSGIDVNSIRYKFLPSGDTTEPSAISWDVASPEAGSAEDKAIVRLTVGNIATDSPSKYKLYIAVKDKVGRETISSPHWVSYDRYYPEYSVKTNDSDYTAYPDLTIKASSPARAYALVRPEKPELYYGSSLFTAADEYVLLAHSFSGTDESKNLLDINGQSSIIGYGSYDETNRIFTVNSAADISPYVKAMYGYVDGGLSYPRSYYGELNVKLLVTNELNVIDGVLNIGAHGYPIAESEYKYKIANLNYDIYTPEASWEKPDEVAVVDNWTPDSDKAKGILSSLEGQTIKLKLNPTLYPDFGTATLMPEDSVIEIYNRANDIVLYSDAITGEDMTYVIPEGINYGLGMDQRGFEDIKIGVRAHIWVKEPGDGLVSHTMKTYRFDNLDTMVNILPLGQIGLGAIRSRLKLYNGDMATYTMSDGSYIVPFDTTEYFGHVYTTNDLVGASGATDNAIYSSAERIVLPVHGYENHSEDEDISAGQDSELAKKMHYDHTLVFTTEKAGVAYLNTEFYQVSNITDDVTHVGAWRNAAEAVENADRSVYKLKVYASAAELNAAIHAPNELPVIADTDNLIEFWVRTRNGASSAKKTMIIHPTAKMTDIDFELIPETDTPVVGRYSARATNVPVGYTLYQLAFENDMQNNYIFQGIWRSVDAGNIDLNRINTHVFNSQEYFAVTDDVGNVKYIEIDAPEKHWKTKPQITWQETNNLDMDREMVLNEAVTNTKLLRFTVHYPAYEGADILYNNGIKLNIEFNEEYAERIGIGKVSYDIPALSSGETYYFTPNDTERNTGIYSFEAYTDGEQIFIDNLMFVHKYDDTRADGTNENPVEELVTMTISVEDIAGNVSAPHAEALRMNNIKPRVIGIGIDERGAAEDFTNTIVRVPQLIANVPIMEAYPSSYTSLDIRNSTTRTKASGKYDGTWVKPFIDVYGGGYYNVGFVDMFGEYHKDSITVDKIIHTDSESGTEYNMGMDISFTEPDATTGKITMSYKSYDERVFVDIGQINDYFTNYWPGSDVDDEGNSFGYNLYAKKTNETKLELDPEKPICIFIYDPEPPENTIQYLDMTSIAPVMIIPEFNKKDIVAEVQWQFDEFGTNELPSYYNEDGILEKQTTTTGSVTAYLKADRHVNPLNGTGLYHTFSYGEARTHTFEFEDLSGQRGSLRVSLDDIPVTLTEPPYNSSDAMPPDYSLEVYGMKHYVYESANEYSANEAGEAGAAVADIGYVQGYLLSFQIEDDSPTKLIVTAPGAAIPSYKEAQSAQISGIEVSSTQIKVDKAQDFDVILIDANGNYTKISFTAANFNIDNEGPKLYEVVSNNSGLFEVTKYIKVKDNITSDADIRWVYPRDAVKETSGSYTGYYKVVYYDNSTIEMSFADELGNIGKGIVEESSMDMEEPVVKKISWAPYSNGDDSVPPRKLVNTKVVALVEFSKPIESVRLSAASDASGYLQGVELGAPNNNQVMITFTDSNTNAAGELIPWDLILEYTAVNGKSGTESIELLPVIDRFAPGWDNVTYDAATKAPYIDVVIENVSEDCYCSSNPTKLYKAGEDVKIRIEENGTYNYFITDIAGNMRELPPIDINCIDNEAPVILLNLDQTDTPTSGDIVIKATMNEKGWIKFGRDGITSDADGNIDTSAGGWIPFAEPVDANGDGTIDDVKWVSHTITQNGSYTVLALDEAQILTETYFAVDNIDRAAPIVSFTPTSFTVREGTLASELIPNLDSGYSLWDNVTAKDQIGFTRLTGVDDAKLNQVGRFEVEYEAVDSAGNKSTAKRYVRVYSKDEPEVLVNGTKTFVSETSIVKGEDITISVNLKGEHEGEPYKMYIRKGNWKAGQMKLKAEKLSSHTFSAEKGNFYTLYIVTQSRKSYLTVFYVE